MGRDEKCMYMYVCRQVKEVNKMDFYFEKPSFLILS